MERIGHPTQSLDETIVNGVVWPETADKNKANSNIRQSTLNLSEFGGRLTASLSKKDGEKRILRVR